MYKRTIELPILPNSYQLIQTIFINNTNNSHTKTMKPNWLSIGKSFQESETKIENQIIKKLSKQENVKKRKSLQELGEQNTNSSSDNDDDIDDVNDLLLRSIHSHKKISYLPNGRVLIISDSKYDTSKNIPSWYLDTRKDPNILYYEGFSANDNDIPKYKSNAYSIVNVKNAKKTKSKSTKLKVYTTTTTANEEIDRMIGHRYYSKRYRRFLLDPTYSKVHFYASVKSIINTMKTTIHNTDMIIFPYIDPVLIKELLNNQQVFTNDNNNIIANDNNNTTIQQTTISITSNSELASILLNKINKYINITIRTNNNDDVDYIRLMHCISIQDVLHELTYRSSGQVTDIFQNIYLKHSKDVRLNMKLILERKLDLLENIMKQCKDINNVDSVIDHNQSWRRWNIHHMYLIVYPILCNLYRQLSHPEKTNICFDNALKENKLDFSMHVMKYQHDLTHFNELNFTDLLQYKLNNIRIDLQRTCKNIQAATELLSATTIASKVSSSLGKLQREQMNINLDIELQYLYIDVYLLQLFQMQSFGKKELAIGMIQALLAFHFPPHLSTIATTSIASTTNISSLTNTEDNNHTWMTIEDFCTSYWESEVPRYGELHQTAAAYSLDNSITIATTANAIEQLKNNLYLNNDMNHIMSVVEEDCLLNNYNNTHIEEVVTVNMHTNQQHHHHLLHSLETTASDNSKATANFLEQLEQSTAMNSYTITTQREEEEGSGSQQQQLEDGMVYSVLHGYKININTNHDSGQIYKKILSNISENTVEKAYTTSVVSTNKVNVYHRPQVDLNHLLTSTNVYEMKWKQDHISSLFQWRPLRALLDDTAEMSAVEQQPERVLFADDLKPYLFKLKRVDKSAVVSPRILSNKALFNADLIINQRLWIRSIQALGVCFPCSECSHSLLNRLTCNYCYNDEVPSKLDQELFDTTDTNMISQYDSITTTSPLPLHDKDHIYVFKLLKEKSSERLCLLSSTLLRKHILSKKYNMDSEFDFVINLVKDSLIKYNCTRFTNDFINELRCLLIYLLTVKYRIELKYTTLEKDRQLLLTTFQQTCRGIIEQSVPTTTTATTVDPMVGNLDVWCQYIEAEISLGNYIEALKFADRILKNVDMEYYNNSNHQEKKLFDGYTRLIFLSIKLLVIYIPKKYDNRGIISQSIMSGNDITAMNRMKQCIHLAIHLAACSFGYSGYLQVKDTHGNITSGGAACGTENDSKGRYLNQLKEATTLPTSSSFTNKSTRKKNMNPTVSTMKITNEDIINAIEIYQLKAMDLMSELSNGIVIAKKVRATAFEHGCVQIDSISACEKIDATPQGLYYILNISAWLQVLSTLYNSFNGDIYGDNNSNEMHFKTSINFGNDVFKASIDVIKSILLLPSNTTTTTTTDNIHNNVKNDHKHLSRTSLLQSCSLLEYNEDCSSFVWKNGFVDKEYLQHIKYSSSVELSMIVLLEKLYQSQVNMIVSISELDLFSDRSRTNTSGTMVNYYRFTHKCIDHVIHQSILDFPLNISMLSSFVLLHSMSQQGYIYIRSYFRELKRHRQYWDDNLQPLECIYAIYNEFLWLTNLSKRRNNNVIIRDVNSLNRLYTNNSMYCFIDNWIVYKECIHWSTESVQRFIDVLENYLLDTSLNSIVFIWKSYLEILIMKLDFDEAKRVYFRAIHSCGWCKSLYMYAFGPLKCVFTNEEVELIQQILQEKGFYLRVC